MFSKDDCWKVVEPLQASRIDRFLQSCLPKASRTKIQNWLRQGCFLLNQKPAKKNAVLKVGDVITVCTIPEKEVTHLQPENIPLDIIFEDEHLIVLNKPTGLIVHPGSGIFSGTLANGLIHHSKTLSRSDDPWRPGIVHRLDKETSGLMVVAKTDVCHNILAAQLADHSMGRTYFALVWGEMPDTQGTINEPIARHRHMREKMTVTQSGKKAVTHYRVLCFFEFACFVQFKLETGRTHQIRVHSSHIRRPIIGDTTYGPKNPPPTTVPPIHRTAAVKCTQFFNAQALHAGQIQFRHPATNQQRLFDVPPPAHFLSALEFLKGLPKHPTIYSDEAAQSFGWFNQFLS